MAKHDVKSGWCVCGKRHDGKIPKEAPLPSMAKRVGILGRDAEETVPRKDKSANAGRTTNGGARGPVKAGPRFPSLAEFRMIYPRLF